ncbi:MAG: methylmalonyl-CoA mutase family protein [Myxococcota bacterium]|nr:methylmalonyl-CoA mutase family protein [Myxococcota bacterium]
MKRTLNEKQTLPVRFITAASLFDGHDAAINIMRRVLQARGAEVIHLGHDRAVHDVVNAAVQEDAHGIAVSSYQGGHVEYFTYMVQQLAAAGRSDVGIFGGGGGTITDKEIQLLHSRGVARLYSVEDGRQLGLEGMIDDMIDRANRPLTTTAGTLPEDFEMGKPSAVARAITLIENAHALGDVDKLDTLKAQFTPSEATPVLGITGVGGAGKSSLTDELIRRFLDAYPDKRFAVLSVDPSRRRSGGALLGDRIRMNSTTDPRVYMRSMATRQANVSVPEAVRDVLAVLKSCVYDLVILETAGIGQSGSEVIDLSDLSLYVMTPEYGAPSQLEKIDMLDFADVIAINKADKRGADDALRYVRKQVQRNRNAFSEPPDSMPVYKCMASRFGDAGVDHLFAALNAHLNERCAGDWVSSAQPERAPSLATVVPPERIRYLSEVADEIRNYKKVTAQKVEIAARADGLYRSLLALGVSLEKCATTVDTQIDDPVVQRLAEVYEQAIQDLSDADRDGIQTMDQTRTRYEAPLMTYEIRGRTISVDNYSESLSGNQIPKVALPVSQDWGEILKWRRLENIPGAFPFTAGVFPFKRTGEDPTRMFAGEGHPERTNHRFHYLSKGQPAARLSTAFDSVTLYGRDPAKRPDIYGKVGNSGVSVATLDDAKRLYSGFDLTAPSTSVSMTINGPAPMLLAMFLNTAIDQAIETRLKETGRWADAQAAIRELAPDQPIYRMDLPPTHDGTGLGLLGVSGCQLVDEAEYAEVRAATLASVRGTVQADILKEDQAQNTCIFSTDFALKMMGDIQAYFIENKIRNFYSVSISGYHIAEAGANPITQLAFTLANGLTFVEYYKSRGMDIDDFARNLSFFFSNGIDPEYAVIGRVARRIWAIALRDLYGAGERSQKLKYHIQTSGRSLHAQEIDFNDIRTTLQALYAIADNCNSLHTNAYDEAITTPTEASVRRAVAIQLIINRELGLMKNENPFQGAYFVEHLTNLVEDAVLAEFDRITERGGVLGAMEMMYQRSKIQEESMTYEQQKHSGQLPIIGVNTFLPDQPSEGVIEVDLIRATESEKEAQITGVDGFRTRYPEKNLQALEQLRHAALSGDNVFAALMETVKWCSLGQISDCLFAVGGQYRRNM